MPPKVNAVGNSTVQQYGNSQRADIEIVSNNTQKQAVAPEAVNYPGVETGESMAVMFAEMTVEGEEQGGVKGFFKQAAGWVGGLTASLWTPETAHSTITLRREEAAELVVETAINPERRAEFVEGYVKGDFAESSSSSTLLGKVAASFTPLWDTASDVRDMGAALDKMGRGEDEASLDLLLSAIGFVPGIGALKHVDEGIDAATDTAKAARKLDDVVDGAADVAKGTSKVAKGAENSAEAVKGVTRADASAIFDISKFENGHVFRPKKVEYDDLIAGPNAERLKEMAWDPAIKDIRPPEVVGGVRIEEVLGRKLTRGEDPRVDFVDSELGGISLKGPLLTDKYRIEQFAKSAVRDAMDTGSPTKTLFVDLGGLSEVEKQFAKSYITERVHGTKKGIFFLD